MAYIKWLSCVVLAGILAFPAAAVGADHGAGALLLIDIQQFYFNGGKLPLTGGDAASMRSSG
jgi:hypothetical protein